MYNTTLEKWYKKVEAASTKPRAKVATKKPVQSKAKVAAKAKSK